VYYLKGKARMTVFNTGPNAMTMDFNPGDVGYVKRNLGHYVENVGDTYMQFIELFRASRDFFVQLADAYAASIRCPAPEYRRSDNREMAGQQPGRNAQIVAGTDVKVRRLAETPIGRTVRAVSRVSLD
jgi:oxalate decarboxylase/phosphoglucose isomerase-like protein (cupin superfamily)